MNTWEDWSDEQINAAVAREVYELQEWEFSDNMQQFYHCGIDGSETHTQPVIDFCNSWAAMGPLIVENRIAIEWYCESLWRASGNNQPYNIFICCAESPLIAAAIVYLQMNGVKP